MEFTGIRKQELNVSGFSDNSKEEIQKGDFSEIFGYSNNMKIEKTGKEIKSALERLLARTQIEKENHYDALTSILAECDDKPDEAPSEYLFRGVKSQIDAVPKMYSYDKCCAVDESNSYTAETATSNKRNEKYDKYNQHARNYIEACVEIIKMKAMIDNLSDSKKYELSVDQIAMLGLKNK